MLKAMDINAVVEESDVANPLNKSDDDALGRGEDDQDPTLCNCCCQSHCALSLHVSRGVPLVKQSEFENPEVDVNIAVKQVGWDYKVDELNDFIDDESSIADAKNDFAEDSIMGLMTAVNMDLAC